MMEFTYNGIVRYGFGFYNPNHAAALICAIIPFLWGWKRYSWGGWLLSFMAIILLIMTFSRTGLIVLCAEFIAFAIMNKNFTQKNMRYIIAGVIITLLLIIYYGVGARFNIDKAISNRPQIWWAGITLYGANPWGVGNGNSGLLVSNFLLENINCRTLINSHLTLIAEYGFVFAVIYITIMLYALVNGYNRKIPWIAFCGLIISASASTIFDIENLTNITEYSLSNLIMSWITTILFLSIVCYLCYGKIKLKLVIYCLGLAIILALAPVIAYKNSNPKVINNCIVKEGTQMPLVIHDGTWTLKEIAKSLPDSYKISIKSGFIEAPAKEVWFWGNVAECAHLYPNAKLYFVSPPEFLLPHPNATIINVNP